MKLRSRILLTALLSSVPFAATAWDGSAQGKIERVDVVPLSGDNAGFRIVLAASAGTESSPTLCGNEQTWAYINKSDDNYQASVSVLLAAFMAGKTVKVHSDQNAAWNNFCHIGYVTITD